MKTKKRELLLSSSGVRCRVVLCGCGGDGVVCDYLIVRMPRCVIRHVMETWCCRNVKWGEVNRDDGRVCERRFWRGGLKREKYNVVIGNRGGRDVSHVGSDNSLGQRNQFRICERRTPSICGICSM